MRNISLQTTDDNFILSINKKLIDQDSLLQFIERLELEILAKEANFGEAVEAIGDEIKHDWWTRNKNRLLGKQDAA